MNFQLLRARYFIYCCFNRKGSLHAEWLKKHNIFGSIGENCSFQPVKIPEDARWIFMHDNVRIASDVKLIAHDGIHHIFNNMAKDNKTVTIGGGYKSYHAPIEIFDNTFIGSGSIILPGKKIGPNAVVSAGAVVVKDVPEGMIVGGNPAKPIGSFDELLEKRASV